MIISLADAWTWYESVKELTLAMEALGRKYWNQLPWEGELGQDNRLRDLAESRIVERVKTVLGDVDDLCVLLLFSVFEAAVRDRVLADVRRNRSPLQHPAVQLALRNLDETIEYGSFFRVLEPFKDLDAALVEQVNQVRQYRNWVAHGRRGAPRNAVDPRSAYERLQRFLDLLDEIPEDTVDDI